MAPAGTVTARREPWRRSIGCGFAKTIAQRADKLSAPLDALDAVEMRRESGIYSLQRLFRPTCRRPAMPTPRPLPCILTQPVLRSHRAPHTPFRTVAPGRRELVK